MPKLIIQKEEMKVTNNIKKVLLMTYLVVMNVGRQLAASQFCSPNTLCLILELDRALFGRAHTAS